MIRRREDGISGRRRYTLVVDSRLSALSSRRLAATVDNRPSVTDATDRYDAGSGWYGREHCPLQSSTPVVPTGTDARNHLPGCPGLRDLPTGEVQGRVSPRSRRPTEARVEVLAVAGRHASHAHSRCGRRRDSRRGFSTVVKSSPEPGWHAGRTPSRSSTTSCVRSPGRRWWCRTSTPRPTAASLHRGCYPLDHGVQELR